MLEGRKADLVCAVAEFSYQQTGKPTWLPRPGSAELPLPSQAGAAGPAHGVWFHVSEAVLSKNHASPFLSTEVR